VNPTIAVLITYYNEGELLRRCLNSVRAQSVQVDEIWVYDDASQDPAALHVPVEMGVKVVRGEKNHGPAYGRNKLLESTACEYVHFHDADDWFHPDWCRTVKNALAEEAVDAVYTEVSSIRQGAPVSDAVLGLRQVSIGEEFVKFCIHGVILVPAGTYRRSTVLQVGGYRVDLAQSEDYDFHLRLLAQGIQYRILSEPLVVIDLREHSRSADQVSCWASLGASIEGVNSKFPPRYLPEFVERLAEAGCRLLRLGADAEAERTFRLAYALGRPRFRKEPFLFQILAVLFSARSAVRVAAWYRRTVREAARAGPSVEGQR
jgi:glycosyltransferase involved in cell wall biosynthesis